jgi:hypothetical protein
MFFGKVTGYLESRNTFRLLLWRNGKHYKRSWISATKNDLKVTQASDNYFMVLHDVALATGCSFVKQPSTILATGAQERHDNRIHARHPWL